MNGSRLSFSWSNDGTKVAKGTQISTKYGAILGGSYPYHFINITEKSDEEIIEVLKHFNNPKDLQFSVADEVKIAVICLQITPKMSPYIVLAGREQTLNETNNFIDVVVKGCTSACSNLENTVLLSTAMDGVSCESVWCIEQICNYLDGKTNVMSMKATNHNMTNHKNQLLGGSSVALLDNEVLDPFILKNAGVTSEL